MIHGCQMFLLYACTGLLGALALGTLSVLAGRLARRLSMQLSKAGRFNVLLGFLALAGMVGYGGAKPPQPVAGELALMLGKGVASVTLVIGGIERTATSTTNFSAQVGQEITLGGISYANGYTAGATTVEGLAGENPYTVVDAGHCSLGVSAVVEAKWTYVVEGGSAVIIGTTPMSGDVTIPSTIDGYLVTGIADEAFKDCIGLTSVTIPASVTDIGTAAFSGCGEITIIYVSDDPTPGPDDPTSKPEVVHWLYETIEGVAPTATASEYNGYLVDAKKVVKGTIQVMVGKPGKKDGLASVKATVVLGTKKVTLKGANKGKAAIASNGPTTLELSGGKGAESCEVVLGAKGLAGFYGAYAIDGARHFFTSKEKAEVSDSNAILDKWLSPVLLVWDGGSLSVSLAKKGKAKVAGTLAGGKTKVSGNAVFLIGETWCCVPVVAPKANLAFVLWLARDGRTAAVEGLGGNVVVGRPEALAAGARFHIDVAEFSSAMGQDVLPYLPDGIAVEQKGAKWIVAGGAKAGKVVYKNGEVDASKLGENPSGLKLTYKSKDGSFKGSFKAYTLTGGKLKATTVNVSGFLVDGVGYGTAAVKGKGSVVVTVE